MTDSVHPKDNNKKMIYHEEYHEKFVEHPELDQLESEHKKLKVTMQLNFMKGFLRSLIILTIALAVFLGAFYFYAKSKAGV